MPSPFVFLLTPHHTEVEGNVVPRQFRAHCQKLTGSAMEGEQAREQAVGQSLDKFLGPEYISYRPGEGGRKLAYLEGHEVIGLLNRVFGWSGWNFTVTNFVIDFELSTGGKWSVGVAATVRLTAFVYGDGAAREVAREVHREDVGYGNIENAPIHGKAMEKCRKEATTDGLKRAARLFGNATGGCVYNREYLERVKKVKGPCDRIEFEETRLLRKPTNNRKRFVNGKKKVVDLDLTREAGSDEEFEVGEDITWQDVEGSGMRIGERRTG